MSGGPMVAILIHRRRKNGILGHLWCVVDYDVAVGTGWEPKWRAAYNAARKVRDDYLKSSKRPCATGKA